MNFFSIFVSWNVTLHNFKCPAFLHLAFSVSLWGSNAFTCRFPTESAFQTATRSIQLMSTFNLIAVSLSLFTWQWLCTW